MAVFRWVPKAAAVAQYESYMPDGGTLALRATIGGIVVSGSSPSTLAGAITAFCDNWNASTHPYFAGITATAYAAAFTLTGDIAGVPYTVLVEEDDGSGTAWATLAATVSKPATGAAHWDNTENWIDESGATAAAYPQTSGDVCIFDNTSQGVHYGLETLYMVSGSYNIQIITGGNFSGGLGLQRECFQIDVEGNTFDTSVVEYRMGFRFKDCDLTIDGSPKFFSFNYSSTDGTQNFIFRHSRLTASVGSQDKCVEMRVVGDSKGSSLIGKLYQSSGGVEIKNEYNGKYDFQIDCYLDGGELHYGDLYIPTAAGRVRYCYLNGGTLYTRIGGLLSAVYGASGKWVPLDLRVLLDCKIYNDCIFDFRSVKTVSIAAGKKLLIYGGTILSAISTPVISFPGGYTLYCDSMARLLIQTCSSFAPSAWGMSGTGRIKRRIIARRTK